MSVPIDLDAIEARADAATEGPWVGDPDAGSIYSDHPAIRGTFDGDVARPTIWSDPIGVGWSPEDFAFVTHAREDIPALIVEVKRLRRLLEGAHYEVLAASEDPRL